MTGQWTDKKPDGKEECVFVSATKWGNHWHYRAWEIKKVYDDGEYFTLLDDGDEWGDLEDLRADLYMILPKHE